eukprot:CAMPEP_0170172180 /NCGR_PEP_ID=MMETSP0040_2-20121228/5418_1 /TAXON_ID=641309 /ORGANISM="Lotharella oceanica, Strain CCMP622" /LENGTH=88 /DNA_ID=CAMNT_0010412715 /DNA_START=348 /DNA_END=614 /DNA_ORIENTATION=+
MHIYRLLARPGCRDSCYVHGIEAQPANPREYQDGFNTNADGSSAEAVDEATRESRQQPWPCPLQIPRADRVLLVGPIRRRLGGHRPAG